MQLVNPSRSIHLGRLYFPAVVIYPSELVEILGPCMRIIVNVRDAMDTMECV